MPSDGSYAVGLQLQLRNIGRAKCVVCRTNPAVGGATALPAHCVAAPPHVALHLVKANVVLCRRMSHSTVRVRWTWVWTSTRWPFLTRTWRTCTTRWTWVKASRFVLINSFSSSIRCRKLQTTYYNHIYSLSLAKVKVQHLYSAVRYWQGRHSA